MNTLFTIGSHFLPPLAVAILASLAAVLASLAAVPAVKALTLQQAQDAVAGMHCSGSVCTSPLPSTQDITKANGATEVRYVNGAPGMIHSLGHFVPRSLIGNEGNPASCIQTDNTLVKELIYNGPYTSRDMAWSINESIASSTSQC